MLHNDIEASQVFISEVQTRLRHVNVNHFIEDLDVGGGVAADSLAETLVRETKSPLSRHTTEKWTRARGRMQGELFMRGLNDSELAEPGASTSGIDVAEAIGAHQQPQQ